MKISDFKQKNLTEEDKIKRDKLKLLLYLVFFIVLIIVVRISNNNNNNKTTQTPKEETTKDEIITLLEPLKDNNYEVNINLIVDNDLINIVKRMDGVGREIFYIKYRGEENVYFRNKDSYYLLNNDSLIETNEYKKIYEYEETFLDINNLIKLLKKGSFIDLKEESYDIRRYKIPLTEVLNIYNEIHNTNEFTSLSKEIVIDVRYKTSLKGIFIDLTDFNNYIMKTEYGKVTYELTFTDINKVDLSSLVESN